MALFSGFRKYLARDGRLWPITGHRFQRERAFLLAVLRSCDQSLAFSQILLKTFSFSNSNYNHAKFWKHLKTEITLAVHNNDSYLSALPSLTVWLGVCEWLTAVIAWFLHHLMTAQTAIFQPKLTGSQCLWINLSDAVSKEDTVGHRGTWLIFTWLHVMSSTDFCADIRMDLPKLSNNVKYTVN